MSLCGLLAFLDAHFFTSSWKSWEKTRSRRCSAKFLKKAMPRLKQSKRLMATSSLSAALPPSRSLALTSHSTPATSGQGLCHSVPVCPTFLFNPSFTIAHHFPDLSKKINPAQLNPDMLIGKYVPNLVAKPFEVTKEYAQSIYDQTSSPSLDKILKSWDEEEWGTGAQRQNLAYAILVELLAYQFASPVRWIETQDLLFAKYDFERFIEIGPSPTLTGMASRTLKAKYEAGDDSTSRTRTILCHAKNPKEIYYQFEDEPEAAASEPPASAVTVEAPATPVP